MEKRKETKALLSLNKLARDFFRLFLMDICVSVRSILKIKKAVKHGFFLFYFYCELNPREQKEGIAYAQFNNNDYILGRHRFVFRLENRSPTLQAPHLPSSR